MISAHVKGEAVTLIMLGDLSDIAVDMAHIMTTFVIGMEKRGVTNAQAQTILQYITSTVLKETQLKNQTLEDFLKQIIKEGGKSE